MGEAEAGKGHDLALALEMLVWKNRDWTAGLVVCLPVVTRIVGWRQMCASVYMLRSECLAHQLPGCAKSAPPRLQFNLHNHSRVLTFMSLTL